MNRWMKRRIERSRERCEKAENQRRPQIHTDGNRSDRLEMDARIRPAVQLLRRVEKLA
jgi:hypothetical protein